MAISLSTYALGGGKQDTKSNGGDLASGGNLPKALSLVNYAPPAISRIRTLLGANQLPEALEQMKILVNETRAASPTLLLPDTATDGYRQLVGEIRRSLKEATAAYSMLSPTVIGIDAEYDGGEYARYQDLSVMNLLAGSLRVQESRRSIYFC
ncbi:MAG: hypothetical protein V1728_02175 [Candidatus Micrarchaeota archaeon]